MLQSFLEKGKTILVNTVHKTKSKDLQKIIKKRRKDGKMERRKDGKTERRKDGKTERWKDGKTERRKDKNTERRKIGKTDI